MKKVAVVIGALIFILFSVSVFAGGSQGNLTDENIQTKQVQDKFEHIDTHILHREGVPSFFADGFRIGVGITTVIQGTDDVNGDNSPDNEAVTDVSFSTDLEVEKEFQDLGKAFVHFEIGQGEGIENDLKVFSNVNQDAFDKKEGRVAELWYEHYLNDSLLVTFGKLDPTVYFDNNALANDETTQFLGRMFRNSPVIEFPDNSEGIRLSFAPFENLELGLGYFDADSKWEDKFQNTFLSGQINIKPNFLKRNGNYRFLVWSNGTDHTKWTDATQDKEKAFGFGLSFDQELTDVLATFFRYGWQDPKYFKNGEDFSLVSSWSAGTQIKGKPWGREKDVLALAIGQNFPSKDYEDSNPILNARIESHLETYYNFRINDHFSIGPDIQFIWNAYGKDDKTRDQSLGVYGGRAQIDF
ncbi:MAG: carbohydrate porin [Candidatus Omnitrophica bacterium]|nr:carbohydrate porin [Candidatus Omnitrophota bacterium]HOX54523.1 carbohydrate porin [Candidatus Omnitrophota bacterium]